MTTDVDVLIPIFNAEKTLAESLESVLHQTFARIDGEGRLISYGFPPGREPYSFMISPIDYINGNIMLNRGKVDPDTSQ